MEPSGTELQLVGTLRAAKAHWRPTLCVLYPGFELARRVADDGIDVIELAGSGPTHMDRFRSLRRIARSGKYDVVHTSLWGAGAFGRAATLGASRPAIVMSERRVEDFRGRRRRLIDTALARSTEEWIGNSADVCDFIVRAHDAPPARVHLIPNGIDTSVFYPGVPRPRVDGDPLRIGAVGRLVEQKGFDVLLRAIAQVRVKRGFEVTVIGDGELRGRLEEQARGLPVSFPGSLAGGEAVADFLRTLDLFVMPSRYEGLPNAVIEALACGLPVIATDVPGMRAATGTAAELVPADDPAALARAMTATLGGLTGEAIRADAPVRPDGGIAPTARSFDDVAVDHLTVFDQAMRRRASTAAGRPTRLRAS